MYLFIDKLIYLAITVFPIFFMAVPRTTTALATIMALLCLIAKKKKNTSFFQFTDSKLLTVAFFSYLIVIILTQISLQKFVLYEYQQQGRIILLFPLFYYIYKNKIDLTDAIKYSIPVACIAGTFFSLYVYKAPPTQWGARHTIEHIDPLNFGYLMLFLAFASFLIGLRWTTLNWHKALCALAFFCGLYMSIKTGSRTGWLAIPFVIFWMLFLFKKIKIYPIMITIGFIGLLFLFLFLFFPIFQLRVDDFIKGLTSYSWQNNPAANESSTGIRISMLRMGWYCFTQAPWFGLGSGNIIHILNIDSIKSYATLETIEFSSSGFMHNELVTQVVKHGIFGGMAYLFMLFCIARIYIKLLNKKISSSMIDAFIVYILFAVVASLSTEILVVKPMILFFGFMLACFAGEALWKIHEKEAATVNLELNPRA